MSILSHHALEPTQISLRVSRAVEFKVSIAKSFQNKMSFRFNARLSDGRFDTVSARKLSRRAALQENYSKWAKKLSLERENPVDTNIPVKRLRRSTLVCI